jgi:Ca2+-binding RTX toxin-like protein
LAVSSNALKSLTVTGDKGLKITNALDFAATGDKDAPGAVVNASALTGVLDIKTTAGETISITGGSVGDVFRLASLDDDDVLDGGDGVDVVMLSVGAETIDGGDGGELVGVSNVEILNVRSTHDSAAVDMADVSGVSNLQGISEAVRTVTPAGDAGDNGSHKISFSLNGTNYETASVDLSGDATADKGRTAAALKVSIDALDGFTATVSNDVVTVTNTNGGQVEISVTNANDQTYTVSAYKNYEFKNLDGTTAVDIFTGNNVTVGLAGPSGDADSLSVNLVNTTADKGSGNTVNELTFSNIETLNLDSSGRSDGKVNTISTLTAGADLGTLNVTGDTDLNLGGTITAGDLKTVNAATFTGNLTIAGVDEDQTITTGAGDDTVAMGANLNDKDVLYLGGNTSKGVDTVTATVNGTTATTGAYNITGAERINLTNSGTAVIDATGIVGASEIAIKTNTTSTTITGLAAGTAVGIGHNDTNGDTDGVFNVSLADATGSSDVLTFNLNDTGGSNTNTVDLKTTDVETVNMVFTDKTDSSLANVTADVDALNAGKIVVSGADGDTGVVLNLQTLDTDTTEVDASAFKGKVIATAGDGVAATFSLGGGVAHNVTGSSKADTFTVGTTTNDDVTIEGGSGEDVLNMTLGNGAQDFHNITAIETINFTVENGAVITTNADGNVLDGINAAKKVTFSGGNSLSTVTLGGSTDKLTDGSVVLIDLSNFGGKLENAEFDDDDFDNSGTNKVQLIGSARKDKVTAGYDADNGASVEINMQDVEVFDVGLRDSPTRLVMDMSLVTGLDQINITDDSSEKIKLEDLAAGVIVDVTSTAATATEVEVVLASASGDSDIQTFIVGGASNNDNVAIKTTDIETLNISSDTSNQVDLELADVAMTAEGETVTVNFTGSNDIELVSTNADITTINASDMTGAGGALIQSGRSGSDAVTYTGSGGDDTFIMANEADVIDGAGGAGDTLDVNINAVIGAIKVDLSQSGDQVTVLNGSSNPAIQQGFENVELDGYTGGESADVTGSSKANKIVGTSVADQIDAGAGNDTVEGGDGNDVINGQDGADSLEGGGGNDTIKGGNGNDSIVGNSDVDDIAGGAGDDTITGGGGNDTLDGGEGIDSITGGSGSDSIIGGAGNDIITGGGGTDTLDGGEGRDSITGGSGDDSIIGGADNDTITGGGGTDTLKGGSGNDSIVGNTGVDDITGGAGDDTITGAGGNDTINGGDGNDSITGGDNIDDITVGGGSDTVVLDSVAVANAVDGADRITGFVVGSGKDVIRVLDSAIPLKNGSSDGSIVLATGSDLDAAHGANANFTVATISTDVSTNTFAKLLNGSSTIAQLETAISTALGTVTDTNFVNTDIVLVAIDDGTHTGIIRFVSNGSDNASSDEISLLGILKGVSDATALVVDNFSIG